MVKKDLHKILVVDDDHDIGAMLKMMLEFKGYSVITLDRGDQTEDMIQDNHVDLVLMDMFLSGANGIEICGRLKQNKATASIPVMMLSAHPNARLICIEAGADEFISKPFEMKDMMIKIDSLLNNG